MANSSRAPGKPDPAGDAAWQALRRSAEAEWVGLALPRFLLRLPYGPDTDSTEAFGFEEMPGTPVHEDYCGATRSSPAWK